MSTILVALFLVSALALCLWRLPVLHPATLWCASWAISGSLFALDLLPYRPLSTLTSVLICGATAAFAAGALAGERLASRWGRAEEPDPRKREIERLTLERAAVATAAITGLMLVAFLADQARAVGLRDTLLVQPSARAGVQAGATAVTIKYLYAAIAGAALAGVAAGRARSNSARNRWGLLAVGFVGSTYFSTGRGTIVLVATMAILAYWLGRDRLPETRQVVLGAVGLGVLALVALTAIGQVQGKTFEHSELRTVPSSFTEHEVLQPVALPYEYATASLAGLNEQVAVSTTWGESGGCATASALCSVLGTLGVPGVEARPSIRPFTAPPLKWNLYTALDRPLLDGGRVLAVPIIALVGLGFGALWSVRRRLFGSVAYAIAAPTLLLSYGQFAVTSPHIIGGLLLAIAMLIVWRRIDLGALLSDRRRFPLARSGAASR